MAQLLLLVVIVLVVAWAVLAYNGLLAWRVRVRRARAALLEELTARHDLVPALADAVSGLVEEDARRTALQAQADASVAPERDVDAAERSLSQALSRLRLAADRASDAATAPRYPELRARLAAAEECIEAARDGYNDMVSRYEARRRQFPTNLVARLGRFDPVAWFPGDADSRTPVGS